MNALDDDEIEEHVRAFLKGRNYKIMKCSAKTGNGLQSGMEWLVENLNDKS